MAELLFEIGTEEIPARFLKKIEADVKDLLCRELKENRIGFSEEQVAVMSTFRRIVVHIANLAEQQADLSREVKGPPLKVAVDASGNWTRAAEGFAATNKVNTDALVQLEGYVWARLFEQGQPVRVLIANVLKDTLQKLYLPIAMRWGYVTQTFIRPVHWVLFLWNGEVVDFEFAGIKAGNTTRGHRIFGVRNEQGWAGSFPVSSFADYQEKLAEQFVIVDPLKRRKTIYDALKQQLQDGLDVRCGLDDPLLEEVTYLTEYPVVVKAVFEPKYLEVPHEVLSTTMQKNQKYFPSYAVVPGKAVAEYPMTSIYFVVADRAYDANILNIIQGNNRVLTARLEDARFFYEEDQKHPLTDNIERLKKIVYHEKLGTLYQKLERVLELAKWLEQNAVWDNQQRFPEEKLRQATFLLKADLVSKVVYEFPELQGIIGRKYAAAQGVDADICAAIEEHYWPKGSGADSQLLPQNQLGQLMSLAEKMDTIVGCYRIGIIPKGSSDPYALRRAAQGIVHILDGLDNSLSCRLNLVEFVNKACRIHQTDVAGQVVDFIWGRFRNKCESREWAGVKPTYDVLDAVLAVEQGYLDDAAKRIECLRTKKVDPEFKGFIEAAVRISRLAGKAEQSEYHIGPIKFKDLHPCPLVLPGIDSQDKPTTSTMSTKANKQTSSPWLQLEKMFKDGDEALHFNPSLLEPGAEHNLYNALLESESNYKYAENFGKQLDIFYKLVPAITEFFNQVMVMCENGDVRKNRLALLVSFDRHFKQMADFEKIVI